MPLRSSLADGRLRMPGPPGFAFGAQVLPFSEGIGPSPGRLIEVALPARPSRNEAFVLSAPHGTFAAGALFGLRLPEAGRRQLLLGRVLEVTACAGAGYDLVGAHLLRRVADGPSLRLPVGQHVAVLRPPDQGSGVRAAEKPAGVATLAHELRIRLLTLVAGERVRLEAPRAHLRSGMYFALRYFDHLGAKRGLVRVDSVRSESSTVDAIEAVLIGTPTRASERKSFRAPFDLRFHAEVTTPKPRQVTGTLTDLSAEGAGIHLDTPRRPGDRIRIGGHARPDLSGAELAIVRTDPHQNQRHGARFLEPDRGVLVLTTLLGFDRTKTSMRHDVEVPTAGRNREAVASPLTTAEVAQIPR